MLTEVQIEERRKYVTGSDSSVILGVNPYESLFDVWQFKLGLADGKDLSGNPRVTAGNYLESAVAQMFADTTQKVLTLSPGLIIHKTLPWMAGNVDRLISAENSFLEIKTTSSSEGWGDQGVNIIPKHYLCQVAHYMAVLDAPYCYVAVLIGGWDFRWYKIERSAKLEQKMIEKEFEFWSINVLGSTPPEPRNYDDVVTLYRNKTIENPIIANEKIEGLVNNLKSVKMQCKQLDQKEKQIKDELALYMRANEILMSPYNEVIATWKYAKDSNTFDKKAFIKDHSDLYEKYLKVVPGSRRLLLKGERNES